MNRLLHKVGGAWSIAGIVVLMWTGQGWSGAQSPSPHADVPVLAAGFGFQVDGESTIVIKTYDARTGVVLSEESFDLAVIEDGAPTAGQTTGRIFAGGIGGGQTSGEGLSKFLLRVYEAQTGSFLWEGQLNLTARGEGETARPIARLVRPTVTLKRTANESGPAIQPYYLVRALDPNTGSMVWQDQFALNGSGRGSSKRAGYRLLVPAGAFRNLGHEFEFMVSAYDWKSETLLWVDTFESLEQAEEPEEEERASELPLWPGRQRDVTVSHVVWKHCGATSCRSSASR